MPKITTAEKLGKLRRIPFTKDGHAELIKSLEELRIARPAAVKELARARELGDLSENGLYTAAKSRLISIDNQIFRAEMTLKLADIIEETVSNGAHIGSTVTVSENGTETTYKIVGDTEANPKENKITQHSPLGRAFLGKYKDSEVILETPGGKRTLKIINIS